MLHRRNWNRYLHLINLGRQLDVCGRHGVSIAWIHTFLVLLLSSYPTNTDLAFWLFFSLTFHRPFFFRVFSFSFFSSLHFFPFASHLELHLRFVEPTTRFPPVKSPISFFASFSLLKCLYYQVLLFFFFDLLIYIYLTFYTTQLHHYDHGILLQGTWRRTLEIFFFPVFVLSKICSIIFSLILLQNSHRHCHRHYCYYRRYWLH